MTRLSVVPTIGAHVPLLTRNLRDADRLECERMGMKARRAVWRSYKSSLICHTAFIDGDIAAIYGMGGELLSDEGTPWLLTTAAVERLPVLFVKEAKRITQEFLGWRAHLVGLVDAEYVAAVRLLELIGYKVGEPEPVGPLEMPFRKFEISR